MINTKLRTIRVVDELELELMKHQNGKYFVRWGFAATDLFENIKDALIAGDAMIVEIKG